MHARYLDTVVEETTAIISLSVSDTLKLEPTAPEIIITSCSRLSEQYCDLRKCSLEVIDTFMSS